MSLTLQHPQHHRSPRGLRPLAVAAALACAGAFAPGPAQALSTFTGLAPVYRAIWFNGTFTEAPEFQFALDWQGYCNAHPAAICTNHSYWGSRFNWDNNVVPGAFSDVRVVAGSTAASPASTASTKVSSLAVRWPARSPLLAVSSCSSS